MSGRETSAVVTGAAMGIGRAIARRLRDAGAHVVAVDRDEEALRATVAELGEAVTPVVGDVADWDAHEGAADAAEGRGRLEWWVNNAGIDVQGGAHEIGPEDVRHGFGVIAFGAMYGTAVAVRRMLPARRGAIVNVGSIQGVAAFPRYFVYGAAKAALVQVARSVAVDYGPFGIRCNTVLPGTIETPMTYASLPPGLDREEALAREGELAPMGRVGQPEDIAEAVAFLLSERAGYVNGTAVAVDGGSTARCYAYPALEDTAA